MYICAKSLQSCPTLCNLRDSSPPGSSVHGIFQARVLECGAIAFSIWSHYFMANRSGNSGNSERLYILGSKITADGDCNHEIKKTLAPCKKIITRLDSLLKSRDFANRGPSSQSYGFSSSHVWIWELDHKEGLALKNWCFWTVVLERLLRVP